MPGRLTRRAGGFAVACGSGGLSHSQAPYGILLARSVDFTPFYLILKGRYDSIFARSFLILFMDQLWDRCVG